MNKAIVSKTEEVVIEAANANQPSQANLALRKKQGGFVSMEVIAMWAVVLAVAIGGLIGVNKVRADNSAKNLGEELAKYVDDARVGGLGGGATPYQSISNENSLAPAMRNNPRMTVTGTTVAHGLGGTGTGASGTITVAPASYAAGPTGSGFSVTATNLPGEACRIVSDIMNRAVPVITINGTSVKSLDANAVSSGYDSYVARAACTEGTTNTMVFTAK